MTRHRFFHITGLSPTADDIDRANCVEAGKVGHWQCGVCEHELPVFMCDSCSVLAVTINETAPWRYPRGIDHK